MGTVGVRLAVEIVDANFMCIGIAVEDDLVDEIGAVEVGLKDEFAPANMEVFGQINAIVPSVFHLRCIQKTDDT